MKKTLQIDLDVLIERLRSSEILLQAGQYDDAAASLDSLREFIAEATRRQTAAPLARALPDFSRLRDAEQKQDASRHDFGPSLRCWGWHDLQTDGGGQQYRWLGGSSEAGISLDIKPEGLIGLALKARAMKFLEINSESMEIRINNERVSFNIVAGKSGILTIYVALDAPLIESSLDLTIYPKVTAVPKETGESSDKRRLSFNVFGIIELRE